MLKKIPDRQKIVVFLKKCYDEMGFSEAGLGFDGDSVIKTIEMITEAGGCFISEVIDGEIVGLFAAMVAPNIMNHKEKRAIEYIWHSDPELERISRYKITKKLLNAGMAWAEKEGLYLVVTTSAKKRTAERILENSGFKELETSYGKG